MLHQALGHALVITIKDVHRQQCLGFTAGLGFLPGNRRCCAHDVLGGIDDVLVAAVVVAEHDLGGARRRELLVELHEVGRRTAAPTIDGLPVIAHTEQRGTLGCAPDVHGRPATADLCQAGPDPGDDLRRDILEFVDHQV
ncbi:hypothetical protein D3C76_1279890 [compost metagenome]